MPDTTLREAIKQVLASYNVVANDTGILTHAALHLWAIEDEVIPNTPRDLLAITATLAVGFRNLGSDQVPLTPTALAGLIVIAAELQVLSSPTLTPAQSDALLTGALRLAKMMMQAEIIAKSGPPPKEKGAESATEASEADPALG